jgi:ankyrin repeat protein
MLKVFIMARDAPEIGRPVRGVSVVWVVALSVAVWLPALFPTRAPVVDQPAAQAERPSPEPPRPPVDNEDEGKESLLLAFARVRNDARTIDQIKRDNALIRAAADGDAERVQRAIKSGAQVNSRYIDADAFMGSDTSGYSALMRASTDGHAQVVEFLIAHNADVTAEQKGRTALYFAAAGGHQQVAKMLVKAGAKGDPERIRLGSDLIRAACKGYQMAAGEPHPPYPGAPRNLDTAPDLNEVLARGADVNWADPGGHTPLMFAANLGLTENVRALLAAGADTEKKSKDGATALSLAEREDKYFRPMARREVADVLRRHLTPKP